MESENGRLVNYFVTTINPFVFRYWLPKEEKGNRLIWHNLLKSKIESYSLPHEILLLKKEKEKKRFLNRIK